MDVKSSNKKLIILIIILSFTAISIWSIMIGLYYHNKHEADSNIQQETQIKSNKYERLNVERVDSGPMVRFVYNALITEEVSMQELISISEDIVQEIIKERAGFQALAIHYYTSEDLIGYPAPLGVYEYAPNGNWGDAGEGKADFSNYKGNTSLLRTKDWNEKPTNHQIEMFKDCNNYEMIDDGIEYVANKYNITFEEAREHIDEVNKWIYR